MAKFHIKKGDTVKVITGNSRGKSGKIMSVLVSEQKALVEGLNMVKRHMKPTASNPSGSVINKEAPIHVSNLMLMDADGVASRIRRSEDKAGKAVRISVKTQKPL